MKKKRLDQFVRLMLAAFLLGMMLPGGAVLAATPVSGSGAASHFTDVNTDNTNLVYINYVTAKGIMSGFPDGSFHPGEGLTRAQAAVVISKAANISSSTEEASGFKDVGSSHWAASYIAAAVKAGYLKGMPDGTYRPEEPLTRAQGISLILRLSKQADPGTALPQLNDVASTHWAARSMAIAIDAGMINAPVNNNIQPDSPINRGDISHALAVLLTSDPDLSSRVLYSTMTVKKGTVKLIHGSGETQMITNTVQVGAEDTIVTGSDGEAVINYPDGSSLFLKKNSTLSIKESQGRAYIKKDGQPGTAVDNLEVELQVGEMFGGLSSLAQPKAQSETVTTSMKGKGSRLLASNAEKHTLLAAGGTPWYKTAQQAKVKVKVDMPWGVAAIRGSFWNNAVNSNGGGSTSLLEGSGSVSAGGQDVNLSPGQSTGGSGGGAPPSAATEMTPSQLSQWSAVSQWVQSTFANMSSNQGSGTPGAPSSEGPAANPAESLSQTLSEALDQADEAAASESSNASTGDGGGSSGDTITVTGLPSTALVPVEIPDPTGSIPGAGTCEISVNPSDATISQASSGDDVVDVTICHSEGNAAIVSLITKGSTGTEVIQLTFSASGYTTLTKTISVTVLPLLTSNRTIKMEGDVPLYIAIYDNSTTLWDSSDSIDAELINLATASAVNADYGVSNDNNYLYVEVDTALDSGIYGIVAKDQGTPLGMAYLMVNPFPAILNPAEDVTDENNTIYMPLTYVDPDWWNDAEYGDTTTVDICGATPTSGWELSNPGLGVYRLVLDLTDPQISYLKCPGNYDVHILAETYDYSVDAIQTIYGGVPTSSSSYTLSDLLDLDTTISVSVSLIDSLAYPSGPYTVYGNVIVIDSDDTTNETYTIMGQAMQDSGTVSFNWSVNNNSFTVTVPAVGDFYDGFSVSLWVDIDGDGLYTPGTDLQLDGDSIEYPDLN